ncbi:MAG: hypothetical protein WDZ31_13595 [Phycisphaeraceae bacterium]
MASSRWQTWTVALAGLLMLGTLHGCTAARPTVTADPAQRSRELSEGYALLHGLLEQNRQVDQAVRIPFRSVSDDTAALLRDIAAASGDAADMLYDLAEASPALGLDDTGLPAIEQATRESIEAQSRRNLLAGEREKFELYLLLSQIDATRYAAHLARQLAEADDQPARRQFMEQVHERFQQLHQRTIDHLHTQ